MDDRERIRLIVISAILFFIINLPIVHTIIFKSFEILFGFNNINTIKCIETDSFTWFGIISISILFAIILLLLL